MHVRFHRHLILLTLTAAALLLAPRATAQERPQIRGGERGQPREAAPADAIGANIPAESERVPEGLEKLFQEIDEASLTEPFKREFQFKEGAAERIKLERPDPKLLSNKFVATIELLSASPNVADERAFGGFESYPDYAQEHAVRELAKGEARLTRNGYSVFGLQNRLFGSRSGGFPGSRGPRRQELDSEFYRLLVDFCPKDRLPSQAAIDFLSSTDCDRDVRWMRFADGTDRSSWTFVIFAPSAEAAKERAAGLLRLVDEGLCRPLQRDCLAEGRKALEIVRKAYDDMAKIDESVRSDQARIEKPSEITADILTQLKAQKVMTDVELVGLTARVNACVAMLGKPKELSPAAIESISDMKVRAEIERVGTKEKLDRLNALIAEGDERERTSNNITRSKTARSQLYGRTIVPTTQKAAGYARLVSFCAPRELKDNEITIAPIEWTN
jgi:hypothetical protein